jgi:cbb3-type cytochrome oxidase subunit 3
MEMVMQLDVLSGLISLILIVSFIVAVIWLYLPRHKKRFEQLGCSIFDEKVSVYQPRESTEK